MTPMTGLPLARNAVEDSNPSIRHSDGDEGAILSSEIAQTSQSKVNPNLRILFVALVNNVGSERVIAEMANYGALCAVMSPPGYYCSKTRAAMRHFPLPKLSSVWLVALFVRRRLETATRDWRPALVVPLDDISAWLLRSLAVDSTVSRSLRDLLVKSFGSPNGYTAAVDRQHFMELASQLGVRKPYHCQVTNVAAAFIVGEGWDFPLFLKTEHSCGGDGVTIAHHVTELRRQLNSARAPPLRRRLTSWAKRFLCPMAGFQGAAEGSVLIQSFAPGVPAFRTVAAWNGRVIAGVSFAAERIHPERTGASTVVRLVENHEMDDTAAAMTAALGCSGFVSYDFMLDEEQGRASLIEMNPRCVGSSHLGRQFGHDICGALVAELAGSSAPKQLNPPTTKLIALFPKELERDPSSPYLQSLNVLHDVPRDDPDVISVYLRLLTELHPSRAEAITVTVQRLLAEPQSTIAS
jgi:ATP-grasp domain-containing protein